MINGSKVEEITNVVKEENIVSLDALTKRFEHDETALNEIFSNVLYFSALLNSTKPKEAQSFDINDCDFTWLGNVIGSAAFAVVME